MDALPDPQRPALIWCPFADEGSAAAVAHQLLDERMVACANILPPFRSIYDWQGQRGDTVEIGVLFKTNAARLAGAVARLNELHPYDSPAAIGWLAEAAPPAAARWLADLSGPAA